MTKIEFAEKLFDQLWNIYASKVPYAKTYRDMLSSLHAHFVNDHVAFRSLKCTVKGQSLGLDIAAPIFLSLGYKEGGAIDFPDQKLFAKYYLPPHPDLPRVFISELLIDKLSPESAKLIKDSVQSFKPILSEADLEQLEIVPTLSNSQIETLLKKVVSFFTTRQWEPPLESSVKKVNGESQYGAWVLLHGYAVNHFTGSVNHHKVAQIDDIEKLVAELKSRGVPMKDEIEGARGSKLRQTSTQAAKLAVEAKDDSGKTKTIDWTYAYFEFAQRGMIEEDGKKVLFQGFLGPQASQLFEMTRMAKS